MNEQSDDDPIDKYYALATRLHQHLHSERVRFADDGNNGFAFAFADVARYYHFCVIATQRQRTADLEYGTTMKALNDTIAKSVLPGPQPASKERVDLLMRSSEEGAILHYETESFYLFAKILLDAVAKFVRHYFKEQRNLRLSSHDNFVKVMDKFALTAGIVYPGGMKELANSLKKNIADYRDYQIAHAEGINRLRATLWHPETGGRIVHHKLHPRENDRQIESGNICMLLDDIGAYISCVMSLTKDNVDKSRFRLVVPSP